MTCKNICILNVSKCFGMLGAIKILGSKNAKKTQKKNKKKAKTPQTSDCTCSF